MTTKKTAPGATKQKYSQLITRSDKEIGASMVEIAVETAKNSLAQGKLSIKSQALSIESDIKKAEIKVSQAYIALENAKAQHPFSVQSILDKRTALFQAKNDLEAVVESQKVYEETLVYLQNLETELF